MVSTRQEGYETLLSESNKSYVDKCIVVKIFASEMYNINTKKLQKLEKLE